VKTEDEPLDSGRRLAALRDFGVRLLRAFSNSSAIELAIYDNQLRFRAVNNAAATKPGIPAEAFVGRTNIPRPAYVETCVCDSQMLFTGSTTLAWTHSRCTHPWPPMAAQSPFHSSRVSETTIWIDRPQPAQIPHCGQVVPVLL
jgi:hypothetical protein